MALSSLIIFLGFFFVKFFIQPIYNNFSYFERLQAPEVLYLL